MIPLNIHSSSALCLSGRVRVTTATWSAISMLTRSLVLMPGTLRRAPTTMRVPRRGENVMLRRAIVSGRRSARCSS